MACQILGSAINGDVRPLLQRPEQIGGKEGIIDDAEEPPAPAEAGEFVDVRHPGRVGETPCAVIKRRDPLLQSLTGRVAGTAIVVTCALTETWVLEGGGLIDGNGHGPSPLVPVEPDLH